jgi:hypothetical protein
MPTRGRWILAVGLIIALVGVVFGRAIVRHVAIYSAPNQRHTRDRSVAALAADSVFWRTFHGGRYDQIPTALEALERVYVDTPNDQVTAAHLGWLHMWRVAERARVDTVPATIVEDMFLARHYFSAAVHLYHSDPRTLGFLASATIGTGAITHDERLTRRGYFLMQDAIDAWPAFNLFTAGYTLSTLPADVPQYHQAVDWQWRTLDICAGTRIDHRHPNYAPYISKTTDPRACTNGWIAPHNIEGFLLNMGDMLVKAGDWQTAQAIYATAKQSPAYRTWPYASVLADRIQNAHANVERFRTTGIMVTSRFACTVCHQE